MSVFNSYTPSGSSAFVQYRVMYFLLSNVSKFHVTVLVFSSYVPFSVALENVNPSGNTHFTTIFVTSSSVFFATSTLYALFAPIGASSDDVVEASSFILLFDVSGFAIVFTNSFDVNSSLYPSSLAIVFMLIVLSS